MTETIAYIRNSLKDIYSSRRSPSARPAHHGRVCGLSTHQLLLGKGKDYLYGEI